MDANGTRFHLLLGKGDWLDRPGACGAAASPSSATAGTGLEGIWWNDDRHEITLTPLPFEFTAAPSDRAPTLDDRRGAARDRFGNWYWIDPSTTAILVRSVGSRITSLFWRAGDGGLPVPDAGREPFAPATVVAPAAPLALAGLTITDDHYLVVGIVEPAGLLVFDLHAGGAPLHYCWPPPAEVPFAPFDLAPRAGGGAWILDRKHARVWSVDRHFDVVRRLPAAPAATPAGGFQPVDGSRHETVAVSSAAGIQSSDAWPVPADLVAIEALPDGALLLMDRRTTAAFSTVYYYASIDSVPSTLPLTAWALAGHDFAFVPAAASAPPTQLGRLYVVAPEGNQSVAFTLSRDETSTLTLDRLPQYFPMRQFEGKGLVAAGGQVHYDFDRTWIPLVNQKRPRHAPRGTLRVLALDGYNPDCVWHRLLIDGSIPPETSVEIWSRAANDCDDLGSASWQREPGLYRRGSGSELPWAASDSGEGAGTWELLFQRAVGRYLDLQIVLGGNGRATPRLRAMRIYYPRFSYLSRYLPGVYREEPSSASFLDRFLANFEGVLTPIEDRIAAAQLLFDVRSAPAETLEWLASWIGLALDPLWSDAKRRALLANAMVFYQYRGTIRGLQMALALSLFDCAPTDLFTDTASRKSPASRIRLVEKFRTREAPAVVFGDPTALERPRLVPRESLWNPQAGRSVLHQRFAEFLGANGIAPAVGEELPLLVPADATRASLWTHFVRDTLGFVPAIAAVAPARWQQFLARRYHGVASFNEVYGRTGHAAVKTFDVVAVPSAVPPDGAPLVDWYNFETIVLAMEASAHRFTVLLPVQASTQADSAEYQRNLEIVRRIVELEKPAHTTFDVRFFWSLFRVGEVRLGYDTAIGLGSRSPDLLTPLVLDSGHLATSYLAPSHPQDVPDRDVLGRDRLGGPPC